MRLRFWRTAILIVLTGLILTGSSQVRAQAISLNEKQRTWLISIVRSDPEAKSLYERLRQEADQTLNAEPHPLKQIQSAGRLQTDPVKIETQTGLRDTGKIFYLGVAYAVTGSPAYATKVKQFVLAWAAV